VGGEPMKSIAVLIPCYQEAPTIAKVVADFRRELPGANIYVYDNNCTDDTAALAAEAGAVVRREKRQGKGHVVASMFGQVTEDILVMVDGDDTYEASHVHALMEPVLRGDADMSVATRLADYGDHSFRPLHIAGNRVICGIVNLMFHCRISDIFSGYRVFTREGAQQLPITAIGFDVETELTMQALYRGQVIVEVPAPYRRRSEGSFSKLRTYADGFKVLLRLFLLVKSYKPLTFFGLLGLATLFFGLLAGSRPVYEFYTEHYVHAVPRTVLAAALVLLAFFFFGLGLVLNAINMRLMELEKLVVKQPQPAAAAVEKMPAEKTA
jgi:glycosyltransferase involved in cell wall biosynthesis